MFDIDVGSGSSKGPFCTYAARESLDGSIPGRNFVLRGKDGKELVTDKFKAGVVWDIHTLKTGWCLTTGVKGAAPQWQWNESLSKFAPEPAAQGEARWKKGFSVRMALGKNEACTFEQSSAAVMSMLQELAPALKAGQEEIAAGKLPLIKLTGFESLQTKNGMTHVPKMSVAKWVDRPACLEEGAEPAPAPKAAPAPAKKASTANFLADDSDAEF